MHFKFFGVPLININDKSKLYQDNNKREYSFDNFKFICPSHNITKTQWTGMMAADNVISSHKSMFVKE